MLQDPICTSTNDLVVYSEAARAIKNPEARVPIGSDRRTPRSTVVRKATVNRVRRTARSAAAPASKASVPRNVVVRINGTIG